MFQARSHQLQEHKTKGCITTLFAILTFIHRSSTNRPLSHLQRNVPLHAAEVGIVAQCDEYVLYYSTPSWGIL